MEHCIAITKPGFHNRTNYGSQEVKQKILSTDVEEHGYLLHSTNNSFVARSELIQSFIETQIATNATVHHSRSHKIPKILDRTFLFSSIGVGILAGILLINILFPMFSYLILMGPLLALIGLQLSTFLNIKNNI